MTVLAPGAVRARPADRQARTAVPMARAVGHLPGRRDRRQNGRSSDEPTDLGADDEHVDDRTGVVAAASPAPAGTVDRAAAVCAPAAGVGFVARFRGCPVAVLPTLARRA